MTAARRRHSVGSADRFASWLTTRAESLDDVRNGCIQHRHASPLSVCGHPVEVRQVDANVLIGAGSLVLTAIGTGAAVVALRRPGGGPRVTGTIDPTPARRLLGRRARVSGPADTRVLDILSRFVFVNHGGRVVTGALDQFEISLFLDLFSACTLVPYRETIARTVARAVTACSTEPATYVAVPKEGNVLLADAVARRLKKHLLVVRALVPAIRFGDPVEGTIAAGACVVVVDDIASDGELLVRTVAHLRAHGARVSNVVCAVERLDGNSRERLVAHDVTLHAPIQLDERTLRELAQLPERELPAAEPDPGQDCSDVEPATESGELAT
jgi:orotate phosphoribosyltransferase